MLLIDVRALSFMDWSGLRELTLAVRRGRQAGRRVVLVKGRGPVDSVLAITRAEDVLETGTTRRPSSPTRSRPLSPDRGGAPTGTRRGRQAPERPLGQIALELRDRPAGGARAAASHGDWLLPGRKHGCHLTAERLRDRLKPLGIRATRSVRHGALLALAGRLPAPILAEHLGLHHSHAAEWVRAAGAPYAEYVALLTHSNRRDARHRAATEH
jgi:hypothetical protein